MLPAPLLVAFDCCFTYLMIEKVLCVVSTCLSSSSPAVPPILSSICIAYMLFQVIHACMYFFVRFMLRIYHDSIFVIFLSLPIYLPLVVCCMDEKV
jgi:hypothetical protein